MGCKHSDASTLTSNIVCKPRPQYPSMSSLCELGHMLVFIWCDRHRPESAFMFTITTNKYCHNNIVFNITTIISYHNNNCILPKNHSYVTITTMVYWSTNTGAQVRIMYLLRLLCCLQVQLFVLDYGVRVNCTATVPAVVAPYPVQTIAGDNSPGTMPGFSSYLGANRRQELVPWVTSHCTLRVARYRPIEKEG